MRLGARGRTLVVAGVHFPPYSAHRCHRSTYAILPTCRVMSLRFRRVTSFRSLLRRICHQPRAGFIPITICNLVATTSSSLIPTPFIPMSPMSARSSSLPVAGTGTRRWWCIAGPESAVRRSQPFDRHRFDGRPDTFRGHRGPACPASAKICTACASQSFNHRNCGPSARA